MVRNPLLGKRGARRRVLGNLMQVVIKNSITKAVLSRFDTNSER